MTKRCAFGLAANLASLGIKASCVIPIVSERYAFGLAAVDTALGKSTGRVIKAVSERVTLGLATYGTGLGIVAIRGGKAVTGRGLFDIEAYGTVFVQSAGEGGVVVLSLTFNNTGQQIGKGCFGITVKFIGRCARSLEIDILGPAVLITVVVPGVVIINRYCV